MTFNLKIIALTALIPMVIGFIYYHPKLMGGVWMRVNGLTEEKLKSGNFVLIMILSLLLSFMMSTAINGLVIHQNHFFSTLMNYRADLMNPNSDIAKYAADFMAKYGREFRTFKHGALHGILFSIFFVLPLIGTAALFERRGAKYIFINWGYWAITITMMGGVICHFS
jgi:hypothetical protein